MPRTEQAAEPERHNRDAGARRLLAMDLDGTSVDDAGRLGRETVRAFARARRAGHVLCFVTGRRDPDMAPLMRQTSCVDYLLLNNGGKIVRTADGAVLQDLRILPRDARPVVDYCLQNDFLLHVLAGGYWGVNKMTPGTREYIGQIGIRPVRYRSFSELPASIEGFTATVEGDRVSAFIASSGLALECVATSPSCTDVMRAGVTKWNGLRRLCAMLSIPAGQVVAAGNYDNDIGMLRHAGIGVAVANARANVRAAADFVTRADNNRDAMAEMIAELGLQ